MIPKKKDQTCPILFWNWETGSPPLASADPAAPSSSKEKKRCGSALRWFENKKKAGSVELPFGEEVVPLEHVVLVGDLLDAS